MTSQKKAAPIAPLRILPGRFIHAPMLSMVGGILLIFSR